MKNKNLIFKFFKKNIRFFLSFCSSFLIILVIGIYLLASTESYDYANRKRNIDIGDICLVYAKYHDIEYYENYFEDEVINVIESPYYIHYLNTGYNPLFLMDDENYSENYVLMDYNTYFNYNLPSTLTINNITLKVNQEKFSNLPGCYINEKAFNENILPKYYGIIVTHDNFEKICSYKSNANSSDRLICLNEKMHKVAEAHDLETMQKLYFLIILTFNFSSIAIYYIYIKKNIADIKMLNHLGYSRKIQISLLLIVPFLGIFISEVLSVPISILIFEIYNKFSSITSNSLYFFPEIFNAIMFSFIVTIVFLFLYTLLTYKLMGKKYYD